MNAADLFNEAARLFEAWIATGDFRFLKAAFMREDQAKAAAKKTAP